MQPAQPRPSPARTPARTYDARRRRRLPAHAARTEKTSEQIEAQPLALVVPDRADHPPAPVFVAELDAVGAALEHGRRVRGRPRLVFAPDVGDLAEAFDAL